MRLSTWINCSYICVLFSMSKGLNLLYGSNHTLYCGGSAPNTPPGDWYRNGEDLKIHSRSYNITNAAFSDDGEYVCRRNGTDAFNTLIHVYGNLNIFPRNCTSMSNGVCVMHVKKGEPVTLCTRHTTTPSTIPQGKYVIHVAHWKFRNESLDLLYLYTCANHSCSRSYEDPFESDYFKEPGVNDSCLAINRVQNISTFVLTNVLQSNELTTLAKTDVNFYVTYEGIPQAYGGTQTLYCGNLDNDASPGEWFHNGVSLGKRSKNYIITNATFDDDGEYQCRRNGSNVFSSPLQVDVYGNLGINPLNCNATSDGVCVKHVKKGQPVTLCTSQTTTPSTIPKGKHVISVSGSTWWVYKNPDLIHLYTCSRESCTEVISSGVNYNHYSNVSDSCITIDNLQENEERYVVVTHFHPGPKYMLRVLSKTIFNVSPGDIKVFYGYTQTLYCGDSVPNTPPGDWYHNGETLEVYSKNYTIRNATFSDDGEYQCRRNGTNINSIHLKVYGLIHFTPWNCNSLSDGICVKHVRRGQPVTLCTSHTTTPSTIPQGKHLISLSQFYWIMDNVFYNCPSDSCELTHSATNSTHYSDVSDTCFTIDNVQENREYTLYVYFNVNNAYSRVHFFVTCEGTNVLYGGQHTLYCGDSDPNTPPGDWFHDGNLLKVFKRSYTIANATFSDDGEYQCERNGGDVHSPPLQVYVYGLLNIIPLDCDLMSEGVCEKHVKRGQPVTLCITLTTTPSIIPQGKNVISVSNSSWLLNYRNVSKTLYTCSRGSCKPWSNSSDVNYTRYSVATEYCLTVTEVQENEVYVLEVLFSPISPSVSNVSFYMSYDHDAAKPNTSPQPNGSTADPIAIAVSIPITIAVVIMIVISTVVMSVVVKRYKCSRYTTFHSESDVTLKEAQFSSPSNLTAYRKMDVKRLDEIGRGSFWKVYKGNLSDNHCAIKRLRGIKKSGNRESLIQKIMKELDTWSSLNHPNILRLYGIYHEKSDKGEGSIPSLIVELMDKSLTDHINSTSDPNNRKLFFPLKTKISVLSQVAGALEYLHSYKSVVHGDLNANNVLLKENSTVSFTAKLADFGMSHALNERDIIMSSVQGAYSYMPPEVHNGGQISTKVDIYSFGVLCVHILSHKFPKPLHALRVDQAGTHILVSEFNRFRPNLMELTEDERLLEPLIEECLQYEPEERLRPVEVIGQLDSVQGRLDLNERRPNTPNQFI